MIHDNGRKCSNSYDDDNEPVTQSLFQSRAHTIVCLFHMEMFNIQMFRFFLTWRLAGL